MVRKIIGTPQNQSNNRSTLESAIGTSIIGSLFMGPDLSQDLPYETINITPRRTGPIVTRLSIDEDIPINILSDHLSSALSILVNRFLEQVADDILIEPVRVEIEHSVVDESYDIGIKANHTIPREYQEYAPQMRAVYQERRSTHSVVIPRFARQ